MVRPNSRIGSSFLNMLNRLRDFDPAILDDVRIRHLPLAVCYFYIHIVVLFIYFNATVHPNPTWALSDLSTWQLAVSQSQSRPKGIHSAVRTWNGGIAHAPVVSVDINLAFLP